MTREELDQQIERAVDGFSSIEGLEESVAERLVGEGFLSYDDLSVIEPDDLMEMGELSAEAVDAIVNEAENRATVAEEAAANERRKQREQEHVEEVPGEVEVGDAEEETPPAGEEVQEQEQEASAARRAEVARGAWGGRDQIRILPARHPPGSSEKSQVTTLQATSFK